MVRRWGRWLAALVLAAPGCSGCGEGAPTQPELEELGRLLELHDDALDAAPDSGREAALSDTRQAFAEYWTKHGREFHGWRAQLVEVDECGIVFTEDDCLEAVVEFDVAGHTVRIAHLDLADERVRLVDGSEVVLPSSGFDSYKRLSPSSDAARGVASVDEPGLLSSPCVVVSGKVFPALQSDDLDPALFFGVFERLDPCDRAPAKNSAEDWSQEGYLSALEELNRRAADLGGGQRKVLFTQGRDLERRFFEATKGKIDDWIAAVKRVEIRDGRKGEIDLFLTATEAPKDAQFRYVLFGKLTVTEDATSEVALKLRQGQCVQVSGTIDAEERSATEAGALREPTHNFAISQLAPCDNTVAEIEEPKAEGAAEAVATGVGVLGAIEASTTVVPVLIAVTEGNTTVLMIGSVVVENSAFAIASAGLSTAGLAYLGFKGLERLVDYVDRKIEVSEAKRRDSYKKEANEHLAIARHACPNQQMNSACFRVAFREAAAFVASSNARIDAILHDDPSVLTGIAKRWHDNWHRSHDIEDWSILYSRPDNVLRRVRSMSKDHRKRCREKVNLAHALFSERLIMGDESRLLAGTLAWHQLGHCYDLYEVEEDYIRTEGLRLVWEAEWKNAGYRSGGGSAGWSSGSAAAACVKEQDRQGEGRVLGPDCELHILGGEIQCVCRGSAQDKAVEELERRARTKYDAEFARHKAEREREERKREAERERGEADIQAAKEAEAQRLVREEQNRLGR